MPTALFRRTLLFSDPGHVADVVAVLTAVTDTEPVTRPMRRRDGVTVPRHEFSCGAVEIQVMEGDPVIPALLEFAVPDTAALNAAIERVTAAGYSAAEWPAGDAPVHAVVSVGGLEINIQAAGR